MDLQADLRRSIDDGLALRRILLDPVDELLADATRLYVVPDRDLALLPFAALPEDSPTGELRFLGDTREIAFLPMAGAPRSWSVERGTILLAGDPLPDAAGEFPALPRAGAELDGIEAIWRPENLQALRRNELVADRLTALPLADYDILHLATHAVATSSDPRQCAVILSEGERLDFRQIGTFSLQSSLVVLSACQTGTGEVIPGEGVVGLAWAFLRSGASGVAASLWNVDDMSTAALMVALHRNLRQGHDVPRSLTAAQREVAREYPHPAYWAPFVAVLAPGR
jgi:CHAT domain-containing protein